MYYLAALGLRRHANLEEKRMFGKNRAKKDTAEMAAGDQTTTTKPIPLDDDQLKGVVGGLATQTKTTPK